ncbi:Por secretion system C-terminal sorting domain-containing protein [Epilithonimonas hungarica]|uniref:Por secretion system C-terminal sorting domain-containing protein n=1 Tax=Epilithonimonas hungarica TaxID=454006 RepID=A0A1G7H902_9FLAO|nr:Por secretion system C-terminal sorting domain-containing protein [Epilithonimonas hungarica]
MEKKSFLKFLFLCLSLIQVPIYAQSTVDLDSNIEVNQVINQNGAVVIKGKFTKPITTDDVKVTIKYKNVQGNWIGIWCKSFTANIQYNQDLTATFELPASTVSLRHLKIELSSNTNLTNWQSISWDKQVSHYKQSDYSSNNCELDENEYTILFTPKKNGTILLNPNGTVSGVKDRVTSQHLNKKLDNIVLSIQGNGTIDNTDINSPAIKIENPNNLETIASSQKYIYQGSDTSPFEYSYHDPVYMFAGKFSSAGFFINFSNWFLPPEEGGEGWGRGYLDFKNPNALVNRYYNLYNYISNKLTDVITDQEPVVIVISKVTGLRVYKANGSYVIIDALSNYNTVNDYGYPPLYGKDRGPGSENFFLSNTSKASLYGVGAIRNRQVTASWNGTPRPLPEIEAQVKKFIKYVGVFGNSTAYDSTDCASNCIVINTGAQPDNTVKDWTKAPNSYIFDPSKNNDGLYIPVGKAYAMWANTTDNILSLGTPISGGQASAYVYWEDNSGLIKTPQPNSYKLDIVSGATPDLSKIKILIDKAKGKGNAVVTFHIGNNGNSTDPIYWSWHIWVTDDVEAGGSTYRQGYELGLLPANLTTFTTATLNPYLFNNLTNRDGSPYTFQWMNRNLGATNAEFLGNDWNKSAGLMYQWGRKDPFPPLVYKDGSAYEINGEAGRYVYSNFNKDTGRSYGWITRPYNTPNIHTEIKENIKYSIKNPLTMISFIERFGHWFSDDYFRLDSSDIYAKINWDLWGDNRKGAWSNHTTSNAAVAADSKSYELKSSYDPCPCGWRIPSHTGSIVGAGNANTFNPLGRTWGTDDDRHNATGSLNPAVNGGKPAGEFTYTATNPFANNLRIYPSLGFDFRNEPGRNLGIIPISGAYVFIGPNEQGDYMNSTSKIGYMNWLSTGGVALATLSIYDNASARTFGIVEDFYKYAKDSKYRMNVGQISPQKGAGPVRCIKDPNEKHLDNFTTEFIPSINTGLSSETLKTWTKDANTYIILPTENNKTFNVRKAFAMQKLHLSDNQEFPAGIKSASINWTTNQNLISNISLTDNGLENTVITVERNAGVYGNAVIALHSGNNGNSSDPIIWSWQIWAPETEPQPIAEYITEGIYIPSPNNGIVVNPTESLVTAPLKTKFMDRNLGALIAFPSLAQGVLIDDVTYKKSIGLQYQWGRKDPIPTFLDQENIFKGTEIINENIYNNTMTGYVRNYSQYSAIVNTAAKRIDQIQKIIKYSVENPLMYLYQDAPTGASKDWLSNNPNLAANRWGHATEKSPYDPCPDGWRIPDASFAFLNSSPSNPYVRSGDGIKGNSPWYYGNILDPLRTDNVKGIQQTWDSSTNTIITNSASEIYAGRTISSGTTVSTGWIFDNANYNIGNYPITGIRGENGISLAKDFPRVGVWTASLGDSNVGNAMGLSIRYSKMATGAAFNPHQAMSCRCAKIEYDANGKEIGRYEPDAVPVPPDAVQKATTVFAKTEVVQMAKKLKVFPNPVKDKLNIDINDDKEYYFQIYNMSGQLVKEGRFNNKQTDVSSLSTGIYLLRINNSESVIKIIKQ